MVVRVASRLVLLLGGLALATALVVAALSLLASASPVAATPLVERDQAATVQRAVEAPVQAEPATDPSPTPAVVLVFGGIVLLAALAPAHRVYVYHRSPHYRSDWL
jgi:sterol desaturase/sphingolipid hydroxylase (fatty acid hydroxylase superfamily)